MSRLTPNLRAALDALPENRATSDDNEKAHRTVVWGGSHSKQKESSAQDQYQDGADHFSQRQSSIHQLTQRLNQQKGAGVRHYEGNDKLEQSKPHPWPTLSLVSLATVPNGVGDHESDQRPEPDFPYGLSERIPETAGRVQTLKRPNDKRHGQEDREDGQDLLSYHEANPTPDLGKGQEAER